MPSDPADMPESAPVTERELARLRGIEEAARWHLAHSACVGWPQGEVLALALGLNPEAPNEAFARLLDALYIDHNASDPLAALLDDPEPQPSHGPDYHHDHAAWVRRQDAAERFLPIDEQGQVKPTTEGES